MKISKEKNKEYHDRYLKTEKAKITIKAYRKRTGNSYQKNYLRKKRELVLNALGGICVVCGFSDYRALQIDHINGGGSKERKERGFSGAFHSHVIKSVEIGENKYQLLCANCNWIKRYDNKECIEK